MPARQCSMHGGEISRRVIGNRVKLGGQRVPYLAGQIEIACCACTARPPRSASARLPGLKQSSGLMLCSMSEGRLVHRSAIRSTGVPILSARCNARRISGSSSRNRTPSCNTSLAASTGAICRLMMLKARQGSNAGSTGGRSIRTTVDAMPSRLGFATHLTMTTRAGSRRR